MDKGVADPDFEALLRYIQESRGLDFRGYKRASLRRRITLRMEAVHAEDFAAYQIHLEVHPGEFEELLNTVLINVTSFFRDAEAWETLRDEVIPQIIANAGDQRTIRIWSVGCASGEEPYSIAMLFAEALGVQHFCARVKIYATDLDEEALRIARQATYAPRDVEGVPPELLERYFERTGAHHVFSRELRKCVIFGRHNVVRDAPISRIDLLVCRNLLIYLESETQDLVLPRLHYAVGADGYLFLGKAETQLGRSSLFDPVQMKHRIFAKVSQDWRRSGPGGPAAADTQRGADGPASPPLLLETVLNETPAAYLVVDASGAVTLANAAARRLLSVGEADIGRPFQDLPISYRPVELRGLIDEAIRERRVVSIRHQEHQLSKAEPGRLSIEVRPLIRAGGEVYAVLLAFTDTTALHALEQELAAAQQNLENSIEELQSANEELETTNEELQSTNEELETTNEELQSTNEELETINEEARSSSEEMESANEELSLQAQQAFKSRVYSESVLRSMDLGVVVIDQRRIVQSWNRWSENAWGLRSEEVVGTSFDALDIGLPVHLLRDQLATVQAGGAETETVLDGLDRRGRRILCRVRVSPIVSEGRDLSGLVLAFEDVTEKRRQEEYARYLGRIINRALNEVYFLDPDTLRFTLANRGTQMKLQCDLQQLQKMTLADVLPEIGLDELKAVMRPLITGEKPEIVFETTIRSTQGVTYPAEICMQYFGDETPRILVAMVHDTSERYALAAE